MREYDWSRKSAFLLDPTECGQILYFADTLEGGPCSFLHDTYLGDPEKRGQVQKTFKISATPDRKVYAFEFNSVCVVDRGMYTYLQLITFCSFYCIVKGFFFSLAVSSTLEAPAPQSSSLSIPGT